jgi:hypothetical protein
MKALIHAITHTCLSTPPLKQVPADVAIGDDANQAVMIVKHKGDLDATRLKLIDGLENSLASA